MTEPMLDPEMVEAINTVNEIISRAVNEDRQVTLRKIESIRDRGPVMTRVIVGALVQELKAFWLTKDTKLEIINADDMEAVDVGEVRTVEPEDWVR